METRLVYVGFDNRIYDYDAHSPSYRGLSVEREAYWRNQIDNADADLADQFRYQRYEENQLALGQQPLTRDQWQPYRDQVAANQERGRVQEQNSRNNLNTDLGDNTTLADGNSGRPDGLNQALDWPVTFATGPDGTGPRTRPDSIGYDSNGNINVIHEHKDVNGNPPVVYQTAQIRGQQTAAQNNGAQHVLTISSDAGLGADSLPIAKPSRNFNSTDSQILYYDNNLGRNTHEWNARDGVWKEI